MGIEQGNPNCITQCTSLQVRTVLYTLRSVTENGHVKDMTNHLFTFTCLLMISFNLNIGVHLNMLKSYSSILHGHSLSYCCHTVILLILTCCKLSHFHMELLQFECNCSNCKLTLQVFISLLALLHSTRQLKMQLQLIMWFKVLPNVTVSKLHETAFNANCGDKESPIKSHNIAFNSQCSR